MSRNLDQPRAFTKNWVATRSRELRAEIERVDAARWSSVWLASDT